MAWTDPFAPPPPLTEPPSFNEEEEEEKRKAEAPPEADQEFVKGKGGAYWPIAGALAPTDIPASQYSKGTTTAAALGEGLKSGGALLGGSMWKLLEVGRRGARNALQGIESIAPSHTTPEGGLYESPLKKIASYGVKKLKAEEQALRWAADAGFESSREISQRIGDDTTSKVLGTLAQAAPSLLPALATGGIGGGPTLVAMVAGGQSFGAHANSAENHLTQHYQELGMSEEDAKVKAAHDALAPSLFAGAMTAALIKAVPWSFQKVTGSSAGWGGAETLGMNMLTKKQIEEGMKIGFGGLAVRGAVGEAVEESLDEVYQGYLEMGYWNPDKSHEEVLYGGLVAGLTGGFFGGGMSGISKSTIQNASIIEHGRRLALNFQKTGQETLPEGDTPAAPDTSKLKDTGSPVTAAAMDAVATGAEPDVDPATAVKDTTAAASSTIAEDVLPKGSRFKSQQIDGATDVVATTDPVESATDPVESTEPLRGDWGRFTAAKKIAEAAIAEGTITVEEVNALESLSAPAVKALIDSNLKATAVKEVTDPDPSVPKNTTLSSQVNPETRAEELHYKINNLNDVLNARGAGETEQQKADVAEKKALLKEAKDELAAIESGQQPDPGPQETKVKGQGPEARKAAIDAEVKSGAITEAEGEAKKSRIDAERATTAQQDSAAATDEQIDLFNKSSELKGKLQRGEITQEEHDQAQKDILKEFNETTPKPETEPDVEPTEAEDAWEQIAGPSEVVFGESVIVDTASVNNNDRNVKMTLAVIEDNLVAAQETLSDNFPHGVAVELDLHAGVSLSVNPKGDLDLIVINPDLLAADIDSAAEGNIAAAKYIAGMDVVFEEELFHLIDAGALKSQWDAEWGSVREDRRMSFGEWYDAHNERIYNDMSSGEKTKVLREYLGDETDPLTGGEKTLWETTYKYLIKPDKTAESALALRRIELDHGGMENLHGLVAGEYVRMRMQSKRGVRRDTTENFWNKKNTGLGEFFFMANQQYTQLKEKGLKGWIGDSDLVSQRIKNAVAIIDQTGVTEVKPVKKKRVKRKTATDTSGANVDDALGGLGAKRLPPLGTRKKLGPVETKIDEVPHFPDDDAQWNGMLARERPMGATDGAEFAAVIYQDLYDYLGVGDPRTSRHSVTFDDNQTHDALHWTWSRVMNKAKQHAQRNNNSLNTWSYTLVRKSILTDFLKHITAATREYGGLVTMSEQQVKEADASMLAKLDEIDQIDKEIAMLEEDLIDRAPLVKDPDAEMDVLEAYDQSIEQVDKWRVDRRKLVREYYKMERQADRQKYKKISLQDKEGGTEDDEGISYDEIFGGDVLISGATQNIERSDSNAKVRGRIQESINALPNMLGKATAASVRMARVVDRVIEGAAMADIAKELGVTVKTAQRDFESSIPLLAQYIANRGWASPERWQFSPAGLSGKQGDVRASFDVRVAKSTEVRKESTESEAKVLDFLQKLYGPEIIYLHDDMRFKKTGGALGAKSPLAAAAARLGVDETAIQKELGKPNNPKIAGLSDEEMTEVANAIAWSHGTGKEGQAAIDKEGFRHGKRDEKGEVTAVNRLGTVVPAVFMAADSEYAAGYGAVEKYGVNFDKVLNGDSPSVNEDGSLHPAVNAAINTIAEFWSTETGGLVKFNKAKEEATNLYTGSHQTVAQAIENLRWLGGDLEEAQEGEIDPFIDDTSARIGIAAALTNLDYQAVFFTHPETKHHTELAILREPATSREDSFSTATAVRSLRTGQLAAKGPAGLASKSPTVSLKVELGKQLDRIAESNAYGTVAGWLSIGGEDLLASHTNANVRALAPLIRQHYDTRQTLEAKLLTGLNEAEDSLTINEKEAARKEFHDYIAVREAGQNWAKVAGKGSHSQVALQKAQELYDNMSPNAKALVDWAHDIAEMTGGINEALDVHVKDGQRWRPIGNLGMLHFPRMLTPKTAKLIFEWAEETDDGPVRKPEYAQLLSDMVANGNAESADAAHDMIQNSGISNIKSNEFLEGVEMARGIKLPDVNSVTGEPYYDYSINGYVNFLSRYSDRIAQIQTFGQSRGKTMTTAWDAALGKDVSGDIKKDINKIRDAIEGRRVDSPATNWMLSAAGAGLLGSPLGSLRNFYTGVFFTVEQAGLVEGVKATGTVLGQYGKSLANALVDFHKSRKRALEGEGKVWYLTPSLKGGEWAMKTPEAVASALAGGALAQDIVNSMLLDIQEDSVWNDEETTMARMRKFNRKTLFLHNTAERMARATNYIGAQQWLRTNVAMIGMEKGNWKSRIAAMKRMGMTDGDIDALIAGKGWALEKGARMAVREKQYSYDITQTPQLFHGTNSHIGRLMFQFQRWGFQRSRDLYRNIILPAIGEEVVSYKGEALSQNIIASFKSKTLGIDVSKDLGFGGKSFSGKPVVRDLGPLIRMLALMVGSGELYGLLREFFKGRDRTEMDIKHIYATAGDAKDIALMAAFERLVMDSAMSGALGISSDYAMLTRDLATRGPRYKSPFKPPSFKIAEDTIGLVSNRVQRGWDGLKGEGLGDDVLDYLSTFPTFQQTGVLATRTGILPLADSIPGVEYAVRDNPSARLGNSFDVQRLRGLARDYSGEMNLDIRYGGQHPKNENTFNYRRMRNSLSAGDVEAARAVRKNLLTEGVNAKLQLRALKQSVRQSQPLNAYGVKSDVERKNFVKWLRGRLGSAEATRLLEVQRRYIRTAKLAGVMD